MKNLLLMVFCFLIIGCASTGHVGPIVGPIIPDMPIFTEEQVIQRSDPLMIQCENVPMLNAYYIDVLVALPDRSTDIWRIFVIDGNPVIFVLRNFAHPNAPPTEKGIWIHIDQDGKADLWYESPAAAQAVYGEGVCAFIEVYKTGLTGA